jgi:hypothetical protein
MTTAVHSGQIDHDTTIAYRKAGNTVATTTDRYQKIVSTGKIDGVNHIGNASAAGDQGWMSADHPIMDLANKVIGLAAGVEQSFRKLFLSSSTTGSGNVVSGLVSVATRRSTMISPPPSLFSFCDLYLDLVLD